MRHEIEQNGLPEPQSSSRAENLKAKARQRIYSIKDFFKPGIQVNVFNIKEPEKPPAPRRRTSTPRRTTQTKKEELIGTHSHVYVNSQKENGRNRLGLAAAGLAAALLATGYVGYELGKKGNGEDEQSIQGIETIIFNLHFPIYSRETIMPSVKPSSTPRPTPTETPSPNPEPTPQPTPEATIAPSLSPSPTAEITPIPTPETTPQATIELPAPLKGEPYKEYVLDGWYLVDGDVFVKASRSDVLQRTYDDLETTAQETIAGPGTVVSGLCGFTAHPLGENFDWSQNTIRFIDLTIEGKFQEVTTGPNGQYQFEVVYLDQLNSDGTINNIETFFRQ